MESQLIIGDEAHDHTLVASPSESKLSNHTPVALPSELELASGLQNLYVTPQALRLCTPRGPKEWIPGSRPELKPIVGMKFLSVEEGIEFYKAYALACGFNVRKSTTTRRKVDDDFRREGEFDYLTVSEGGRKRRHELVFDSNSQETKCSCKMFERQGLPCRHMIFVWKGKRVNTIPEEYVMKRWTKLATKQPFSTLEGDIMQQCAKIIDKKRILNELWSEIHSCVHLAENNEEDLSELVISIRSLKLDMEAKKVGKSTERNKTQDIELLIGSTPKISKNKGSGEHVSNNSYGSAQRMKGDKEKAIEKQ